MYGNLTDEQLEVIANSGDVRARIAKAHLESRKKNKPKPKPKTTRKPRAKKKEESVEETVANESEEVVANDE